VEDHSRAYACREISQLSILIQINSEVAAAETKGSAIAFLIFDQGRKNARPVGTGTLVRSSRVSGILTAAHVLDLLPQSGEVGLVLFPSVKPYIQNLKLEMQYTERVAIWNGVDSSVPDIGFLRIPDRVARNIELAGCIFYNLDIAHHLSLSSAEHNIARCYAIVGVIGEWSGDLPGKLPNTRIKDIRGMFCAVKRMRTFTENNSRLFDCQIHYEPDVKIPTSYGGVSGGGLWELQVELSGQRIIGMKKNLQGVAFRQSDSIDGERSIVCQGPEQIERLTAEVKKRAFSG
jgi:hypothetical protein